MVIRVCDGIGDGVFGLQDTFILERGEKGLGNVTIFLRMDGRVYNWIDYDVYYMEDVSFIQTRQEEGKHRDKEVHTADKQVIGVIELVTRILI